MQIRNDTSTSRRPSTLLLIVVNSTLFLGLAGYDANSLGFIVAIIATIVFAIISGVWHLILFFGIERRFIFHPVLRTVLFNLPVLLLVVLISVLPVPPQPPNKMSPSKSPSGRFEVRVKSPDMWHFSFKDLSSAKSWEDTTPFVGHLNVYWIWDNSDRLWLYNSDDGRVWFWESTKDGWKRNQWSNGGSIQPNLIPPNALYPHYAGPNATTGPASSP